MNTTLLVQQLQADHLDAAQRTIAQSSSQESVPFLLDLCSREEETRIQASRRAQIGTILTPLPFALILAIAIITSSWLFLPPLLLSFGVMVIRLMDPRRWYSACPSAAQRNSAVALTEFAGAGDDRITAALIDALDTDDEPARGILRRTLTHLLWNIDADDATLWLDDARRKALRRDLLAPYSVDMGPGKHAGGLTHLYPGSQRDLTPAEADYCLAAMKALALTRDAASAKLFRALARSRTYGPNGECVAAAATECLALLAEQKAAWERDAGTLRKYLEAGQTDAARDYLGALGEARGKALLVAFLSRKNADGRARKRNHSLLLAAAGLVVGGVFLAAALPGWTLVTVAGVAFLARASLPHAFPPGTQAQEDAAALLARYNDARLAAPVIDILRDRPLDALFDVLPDWLKALRPGDGMFLAPRHREFLRAWLGAPDTWFVNNALSVEVGVGALHALGIAGDLAALPAAEAIVYAHSPVTDKFRSNSLRDAAYACWVRLREARDRQAAGRPRDKTT